MFGDLVISLFTAWFLTLFRLDAMLIEVLQPFTSKVTLTSSHYYVAFCLIGLVGGVFRR